jgi:hypothetical protein
MQPGASDSGVTRQAITKHLRTISEQWDAALARLKRFVED